MSRLTLETIIGRAILDEEFRLVLFPDPETALAEYELTANEIVALKSMDAESLDACALRLGGRILGRLSLGQSTLDAEWGVRHGDRCANRNIQPSRL